MVLVVWRERLPISKVPLSNVDQTSFRNMRVLSLERERENIGPKHPYIKDRSAMK